MTEFRPLQRASFGARCFFDDREEAAPQILAQREAILHEFNQAGGLLVLAGLGAIDREPSLLLRISEIFGPEVENYRETLTAARFFHETVPEILVLSNMPPCNHPPPPKAEVPDGGFAVQFPTRRNWHTDQSYRRPPPDVTLLYGSICPPSDQGQTLFADCTAAYASLPQHLKERIQGLNGIHAPRWIGRRPEDVRNGVEPRALLPHQLPQKHPLVRFHPDTGRPALYICEENQMDFVDGPISGLEPGPDGEGAALLRELLSHATQPERVYVHEWQPGDLVIADNRCLLHAASWYDAGGHDRLMWRTTVMGNPGAEYAGEARSWIPSEGHDVMEGMEDA
ncbi:MAG: TauD/TfdA family dioxygenase [Pseudomonadota bacterium]